MYVLILVLSHCTYKFDFSVSLGLNPMPHVVRYMGRDNKLTASLKHWVDVGGNLNSMLVETREHSKFSKYYVTLGL